MLEPEAPKDRPPNPAGSFPASGAVWKDRYRIEKELGRGGFGVVYLARDQQLHSKAVVLKVLHDESTPDPYFQKKFQQEIEALARMDHPGVVGVLDVGESPEGRPFLVMQFVEGVTLRSAIPKDGMDFPRVAHILRQVGQALGAAHDKGIYHRDLKPENIMLTRSGETEEYVKLIDFGIAAVRDSQIATQTQSSRVVGTLSYMAPEQVMGKGSPSSDVYSLGVIAFEMLTGERPEVSWEGVAKKPREVRPAIPEAAQEVILTALSYQPEKRMMSPREFGDRIARALGTEPTVTAPLPAAPAPQPAVASRSATSSSAGLEMAYVLFMDIVAYSKMPMDLQSRRITQLVDVVRDTPSYRRAQQSDQIISLPTGDGMALVFFQNPTSPVECATEISRALKSLPEIKLRMGVHTGPVYRIADINTNRNVAGGGINLAQRVMDCGDAGHILVSKTVADILGQLSDWEPMLHELGEAEVKHGVKVNIVNFYTGEVGNSTMPEKLKKSQALPAAVPAAMAQPMQAPVSAPVLQAAPQLSAAQLISASQPATRKSGSALMFGGVGALVVALVVVAAMKFGPWNKGGEPANSGIAPAQSSFGPTTGETKTGGETITGSAAPGVIPPSGPPPANIAPPAASSPEPAPPSPSSAATSATESATGSRNPAPVSNPQGQTVRALRKWEGEANAAHSGGTPSEAAPAAAAAPLPTPAERAELTRARQRMFKLAARAEAINESLRNLQEQQGKQGFGLRGDMAAARASMEYLMGETKASIDAKDFDAANQSMDLAEPQIEKLEGFLGR